MKRQATFTVVLALWQTAVGALLLSVELEKDTVLPYEPVFGEVVVTNIGEEPVVVPRVTMHNAPDYFDVSVTDDEGNVRICDLRSELKKHFTPGVDPGDSIAPGTSVASPLFDIGEWMGVPSPDEHGFVHLPYGTHTVSADWREGMFSRKVPGLDRDPSSPLVELIVRPPREREIDAMRAYGEALFFRWTPYWKELDEYELRSPERRREDSERRTTESVRRIRASFSDINAYAAPATALLLQVAFGQMGRLPEGARRNMADSVARLYRNIVEQYPDTPTAKFWLRQPRILECAGKATAYGQLLQTLATKLPQTRAGQEARRILLARRAQGGWQ